MTKDKKEALVKYQSTLRNRLTEAVPSKHLSHPATYKAYLVRELKVVTDQLEAERLSLITPGAK